ncbi:DUF6476 family protein [Tabrizicola sp.]|uniref:DUF6476 family protein n=1 Tax=Tabrizicola sp. TaxID=2005166 RepID=UPI003F2FCBE5
MPEPTPPDAPEAVALPPSLRLLKWLVIILTLTMIGGVITVVGLIVTRMPQAFTAAPTLPAEIALPEGKKAAAVTFGTGWIAVVTTDDHILIFGRDGTLRQDTVITPVAPP